MNKKLKDYKGDFYNPQCMILPEPSLVDGLGWPIVNPDGSVTYNRVRDVFFYNDIEHAKSLDPIALRQVLSTEMSEQGFSSDDLDNDDTLNDVFDSCPSRYLYSPIDLKEYISNIKHGIKSRIDYAKKISKSKD